MRRLLPPFRPFCALLVASLHLFCLYASAASTSPTTTKGSNASEILILDWHYVVKIGIEQVRSYLDERSRKEDSQRRTEDSSTSVTLFMDDLYAIRTPQSRYFPDYCHRGPLKDGVPASGYLPPPAAAPPQREVVNTDAQSVAAAAAAPAGDRTFGNLSLTFVPEENYFCPTPNSVFGPLDGALRQGRWVSEKLNGDGSVPKDDGSFAVDGTATRFYVDKTDEKEFSEKVPKHLTRKFVLGTAYRDFFSQYKVCVMYGGRQTLGFELSIQERTRRTSRDGGEDGKLSARRSRHTINR